jgi:hypothetical protein
MQNLGPIYKTKNVYSLMFMLVIIHRAYVLKLFLGITLKKFWCGTVASQIADSQFAESQIAESN